MSTFQAVLLVFFGVALLVGVLIFAGVIPGFRAPSGGVGGTVVMWGAVSEEQINEPLQFFRDRHRDEFTVEYVKKDARTMDNEFTEALAAGKGPDLILLPHASLVKQMPKLAPLSYDQIPERQFTDTFARESALYLGTEGVWGVPLLVDPLVLYYNTDLLSSARLTAPPKTWAELPAAIKALVKTDSQKNLLQAALPLGRAGNITHAKDLLALLLLQAGNPIVAYRGSELSSMLLAAGRDEQAPAAQAIAFFNRFADPANTLYTWNSALPEARDAFARGQAAMYLGFGSEYDALRRQNPQLNFDVTVVPQVSATAQLTVGEMLGVSAVRGAQNPLTAAKVALALGEAAFVKDLAEALKLAPSRNDLLRQAPRDPVLAVIYQSGILSRGWLDPEPTATDKIFRDLVEGTQSGARKVADALQLAQSQLEALLKK